MCPVAVVPWVAGWSESQAGKVTTLAAAQAEAHKLAQERDIPRQAAKYLAGETNW